MPSLAVRTRFAPSEFPDIWSTLPLRSNQASVLHGYPPGRAWFARRHNPGTNCVPPATGMRINVGEDTRGYCFAAEMSPKTDVARTTGIALCPVQRLGSQGF